MEAINGAVVSMADSLMDSVISKSETKDNSAVLSKLKSLWQENLSRMGGAAYEEHSNKKRRIDNIQPCFRLDEVVTPFRLNGKLGIPKGRMAMPLYSVPSSVITKRVVTPKIQSVPKPLQQKIADPGDIIIGMIVKIDASVITKSSTSASETTYLGRIIQITKSKLISPAKARVRIRLLGAQYEGEFDCDWPNLGITIATREDTKVDNKPVFDEASDDIENLLDDIYDTTTELNVNSQQTGVRKVFNAMDLLMDDLDFSDDDDEVGNENMQSVDREYLGELIGERDITSFSNGDEGFYISDLHPLQLDLQQLATGEQVTSYQLETIDKHVNDLRKNKPKFALMPAQVIQKRPVEMRNIDVSPSILSDSEDPTAVSPEPDLVVVGRLSKVKRCSVTNTWQIVLFDVYVRDNSSTSQSSSAMVSQSKQDAIIPILKLSLASDNLFVGDDEDFVNKVKNK